VSRTKDRSGGSTLPLPLQFLAAWLAVWLGRALQDQVDYLKAENRVLMNSLGTNKLRLTGADRRRLAVLAKKLGRKALAEVATIASPETILRWYRELVAKEGDGRKRRGPGRPKKRGEIAKLAVRMARENETWGYTRIKGALQNLGHEIGRNTIKRILQEHGIEPATERGKRMPWSKFIKAHLCALVGMDFLGEKKVARLFALVHYRLLFVIGSGGRSVEVAGIRRDRVGDWTEQMTRNLADMEDGGLLGKRNVLLDRDPLCTRAFRKTLEVSRAKVVHFPRGSPNPKACPERLAFSTMSERLERTVPAGEEHPRRALSELVSHHHHERSDRWLGNALIAGKSENLGRGGTIVCRQRLGRSDCRQAA
jgi:putative transposase